MLGLFGTLGMGTRSLQAQQQGIETAGHNLANVNNPAYARQRVRLSTSSALPTPLGPVGTGAQVTLVEQIRDRLLDQRISGESSVSGYWLAQQKALQYAQAELGQGIDRQASGAEGAAAAGAQRGLADGLQDLFNAFQSVATSPTSIADRQVLLQKAQSLASRFNVTDQRLSQLRNLLNEQLQDDVAAANGLLSGIASLNDSILNSEVGGGAANDLRDLRQQKLEALAQLVKVDAVEDPSGSLNLSVSGTAVVTGKTVNDTLEAFDPGTGALLVRTATSSTALTLTGGAMQGEIDARDGALTDLQNKLNAEATELITRVNALHGAGFGLTGSTGAAFFSGTSATTISVNATLTANPALVQAAGVAGAAGDNQVALALAQLAETRLATLGNQTLQQDYAQTVAALGQSLASANEQVSDQEAVGKMLGRQRASVSGVSLDEEMTELVKYQKAFAASAKLISTVDEMLDVVVNMKR
ncbi:MAG: flagellar hook-associated protein FlgK [Verrucomicrobia bacterium]|nr:flagellar hook-associated protein FlgK [Verrucomicrobiota bacterium]